MSDCWTCEHGWGCDSDTARHCHTNKGYDQTGHSPTKHGIVIMCRRHKMRYAKPFYKCGYTREPGSESDDDA